MEDLLFRQLGYSESNNNLSKKISDAIKNRTVITNDLNKIRELLITCLTNGIFNVARCIMSVVNFNDIDTILEEIKRNFTPCEDIGDKLYFSFEETTAIIWNDKYKNTVRKILENVIFPDYGKGDEYLLFCEEGISDCPEDVYDIKDME